MEKKQNQPKPTYMFANSKQLMIFYLIFKVNQIFSLELMELVLCVKHMHGSHHDNIYEKCCCLKALLASFPLRSLGAFNVIVKSI